MSRPVPADEMPLDEVAARLRLHPDSLYGYFSSGEIPAIRIGARWRVPRGAFERWWATAGGKVPLTAPGTGRGRRRRAPVVLRLRKHSA